MMSGVFAKPGGGRAITDVYDPQDRRILVRYPTILIIILSLTGVLAFGLMGYLGYREDQSLLGKFFEKAWPLFLWFSALVFTLEISVLRHHRLRRRLIEALVVTLISMLFVGISALAPQQVLDLLSKLLNIHIAIPEIGSSPWTYAILNFGAILIFWADTIRRWVRVGRGQPAARVVDLGIGALEFGEEGDLPTLPELIAGDLIAGGVLVALLSLLFRAEVIDPISQALQVGAHITTCTVSWPIGLCHIPGGGPADPPTLTRIDIIQALIYLPLGFITLALTATANAFNAASETTPPQSAPSGAIAVPGQEASQALSVDVQPDEDYGGDPDSRGRIRTTSTVIDTIYDALRAPLQRRIRLVIDNLLIAMRNVVWPIFILLGMVALGQASHNIAFYLHLQSDQRTCAAGNAALLNLNCSIVQQELAQGQQYIALASSVALVVAAAIAIVIALMMLVFNLRVASNTFRFLGVVAYIGAITLWIFSLALSISNVLFNLLGFTLREPFPLFGASTTVSLLVFLLACVALLVGKSRSANRKAAVTAAVN